ncbi:MAG TPA: dihydropteroate synthase [Salinimicrobium sp.]|nr:dihydropteroate synthase [Salinimicrobium sp.]
MTINCKGKLIDLSTPKVMGILNITPDSFSDGGKYMHIDSVLQQTEKMLNEGATFIDVGAYSSRPGAEEVSEEQELKRILPVVETLVEEFPNIILSIDTFRSKIARNCIDAGAAIINDISSSELDPEMMKTVASLQVPYIMMHMRGNPQTMKNLNEYNDLTQDLIFYFSEKINEARNLGINDIIIDPGFGFSKNGKQNFELLSKLKLFKTLELPLLVGVSRKNFIQTTLDINPAEADHGTSIMNTIALLNGASILRVHNVKFAVECVKLVEQLPDNH